MQLQKFQLFVVLVFHLQQLHVQVHHQHLLMIEMLYFENDHPTSIISKSSLTKFNTMAEVNRLFDSGNIVIYDTGTFLNTDNPFKSSASYKGK